MMLSVMTHSSFAEDNAFYNLLPNSIDKESAQMASVIQLIDVYGRLQPDLIYEYINYLNMYYSDSISFDSTKIIKKTFQDQTSFAKNSEAKWRSDILDLTLQHFDNKYVRARIQKEIPIAAAGQNNPGISSELSDKNDINHRDFMACLYYGIIQSPLMTQEMDYTLLRKEHEDQTLLSYQALIDKIQRSASYNYSNEIYSVLDYWYLFDNKGTYLDSSHPINIVDIFVWHNKYRYSQEPNLSLTIGSSVIPVSFDYTANISFENVVTEIPINGTFNQPHAIFGIGLNLLTSKWEGPLSKFDLGLLFSSSIGNITKEHTLETFHAWEESSGQRVERFVNNYLRTENFRQLNIDMYVTTPLIYATHNLHLEAGLLVGLSRSTYDLVYNINYSSSIKHPSVNEVFAIGNTGDKVDTISDNQFGVNYYVELTYTYNKRMKIGLSISRNWPALSIAYNWPRKYQY